jgi:hypothetical protein
MKVFWFIAFILFVDIGYGEQMELVEYERHEFRGEPEARKAALSISKEEYSNLVHQIQNLDLKTLGDKARYTTVRFELDNEFDEIQEWETWLSSVCDKHRDSNHRKMNGP